MRIDQLHRMLAKGESIANHLIDIKKLDIHFQFFCQHTSLDQALMQSIGMYRYEQQTKRDIVNSCMYPAVVMGISIICFLIMVMFVLPMMLDLLASMNMKLDLTLLMIVRFVSVVLIIAILVGLILGALVGWHMSPTRQLAFYHWLNTLVSEHILKFFHSYLWAGYWLEFQKRSCSTMDALAYMQKMEYRPLMKHSAKYIDEQLKLGVDLVPALKQSQMFSESLSFHFDVGIKCQQLEDFLSSYVEESKKKMSKLTRRLMYSMQMGSYLFVGMIVALMSQILLAPMDLIAMLE